MKRKSIVILFVLLVVGMVGGNALLAKEPLKIGITPNPGVGGQGITVNSISFTEIKNLKEMPAPVQEIVKNHRKEAGYEYWQSEDGVYYLAIFAGEKRTGGYGIQVVQIEDNEGVTNVTVKETTPAKDAMVTMAMTYPYTVVKFTGTTDQFQLFFTNGQKMTQDGQIVEIIECKTGLDSATPERLKTLEQITQAWAERLMEISRSLATADLNPEERENLEKEKLYVHAQWQQLIQELQEVKDSLGIKK